MKRARLLRGACGVVLVMALSGAAEAADRRVLIANESSRAIVALYGSRAGGPTNENKLGEEGLAPGGSAIVDFDDGSGYCSFAFRAVFDDGVELVRPRVNVCEVGTYRYTN